MKTKLNSIDYLRNCRKKKNLRTYNEIQKSERYAPFISNIIRDGRYLKKYKYMVMSGDQNAARNNNIQTDYSSFQRVEQFKYF